MLIYVHFFSSFIRLCDYLVITMLHRMSVHSAEKILFTLEDQTTQIIQVQDLIKSIPESIEEQEKLLQVSIERNSMVQIQCFHS